MSGKKDRCQIKWFTYSMHHRLHPSARWI